jgi:uncharacterized protein
MARKIAVCLFSFVLLTCERAHAQNVNSVMNMFGAIMRGAIVENARNEWSRISPSEASCITQQLQQHGLSVGVLIQNGIAPSDPRVAGVRYDCRSAVASVPPSDQGAQDLQNLSAKPTFDCTKARSATGRIICLDQAGANADWDLISAYWARYFSLPEGQRDTFDHAQQDWLDSLKKTCSLDAQQSTFSSAQRQCVLGAYGRRAAAYRSQLQGDALDESRLSPEQRGSIQQALADRGLLHDIIDGEFGSNTRAAIRQFQVQAGFPQSDFLTSQQRQQLLQGKAVSSAVENCKVQDPTGTPLNLRAAPNGDIVGNLDNGSEVRVVETKPDVRGHLWALIARVPTNETLGWGFRDYLACGSNNPSSSGPNQAPLQPKETPQLKDARAFLGDARKFMASQQTVTSISEIANQAAALQIALDNFDDAATAKSRQKLAELLNAIPGFNEFEHDQQDTRIKQAEQELAEAKKQGAKNIFFIDYYLRGHLGDPSTGSMNSLRSQVDASLTKNRIGEIADANNAVSAYVQKNDLSDAYREAAKKFDDQTPSTAPNLGFGPKSQFVLDGQNDDILLLYNSSKTAPSVWQNVGGEIVFQNNTASVCFAQSNPDPTMLRYIERKLRGNGATNLTTLPPPCDLSRVAGSIDIIAFQRRGFLGGPTDYNRTLVKMIEDGTLRKYQIVTDYPKVLADRLAFSRQLENDVENDERKGFGVITVIDSSSACVIAPQNSDTMDGIRELVSKNRDLIAPKLSVDWEFVDSSSADIAFLNLQKQYCGSVAAGVADLRVIMQALQRDKRPFKFAAVWWSEQNVKQAAVDAHVHIQETKKETPGIPKTSNSPSPNDIQKSLRAQYGGQARSLLNPLRDLISALAENRRQEDADLFPNYSSWLKERFDQQWQTSSVNSEVEDFGTVKWENRNLDAIVVRVRIDQMNSALGKYDHPCFDFGIINDSEFNMWRNPIAVDCNSISNLRNWEIRQGFQSEWNVPGAQ